MGTQQLERVARRPMQGLGSRIQVGKGDGEGLAPVGARLATQTPLGQENLLIATLDTTIAPGIKTRSWPTTCRKRHRYESS